jgi:hypothetical protein
MRPPSVGRSKANADVFSENDVRPLQASVSKGQALGMSSPTGSTAADSPTSRPHGRRRPTEPLADPSVS